MKGSSGRHKGKWQSRYPDPCSGVQDRSTVDEKRKSQNARTDQLVQDVVRVIRSDVGVLFTDTGEVDGESLIGRGR